jgi:hypothetical protein
MIVNGLQYTKSMGLEISSANIKTCRTHNYNMQLKITLRGIQEKKEHKQCPSTQTTIPSNKQANNTYAVSLVAMASSRIRLAFSKRIICVFCISFDKLIIYLFIYLFFSFVLFVVLLR